VDQPENNVRAIFIAALDHEPGPDRAAYLDIACTDNADLKHRAQALLAAHERADEVLGPADESATTDSNPSCPIVEAVSGESPGHDLDKLRDLPGRRKSLSTAETITLDPQSAHPGQVEAGRGARVLPPHGDFREVVEPGTGTPD